MIPFIEKKERSISLESSILFIKDSTGNPRTEEGIRGGISHLLHCTLLLNKFTIMILILRILVRLFPMRILVEKNLETRKRIQMEKRSEVLTSVGLSYASLRIMKHSSDLTCSRKLRKSLPKGKLENMGMLMC